MIKSINMTFANWLQGELDRREWNQADLSRASGLSSAAISRILTGTRQPGLAACRQIAKALHVPAETVLQAAGVIQPPGQRNLRRETIEYLAEQMDDTEYNDLLDYIRFRLSKQKSR